MTYEAILADMKTKYRALSGFNADDASDIGIRLKVLAAELAAFYPRLAELEKQIVPLTSTGRYLEYHAEAKGIFRKPGLKAAGSLRFSRERAAERDMLIPAGVVCAIAGDGQNSYVTTKDGKLAAGETYADIDAEAVESGEMGNAAARTINMMITPPPGITAVENPGPFTGGARAETDEELRQRLLFAYKNLSNGTNAAYYYDAAMSHQNVVSANVLPRKRGRGSVEVVIKCANQETADETASQLQRLFEGQKEINVDVSVEAASVQKVDIKIELTKKSGYSDEAVIANAQKEVDAYFAAAQIGEVFYKTGLGAKISAAEGVATYRIIAPLRDYAMNDTQVMGLGATEIAVKAVA